MENKSYATNKRAHFDYEIIDRFTAGIVLSGNETKSVRFGNASLKGAYVTISKNGEVWLTNAHINPYSHGGPQTSYDAEQPRKLLLKSSEIAQLKNARDQKLVIVALSLFPAGRYIKLSLATAKPKKLYDKRQTIRKHDTDRETKRTFKR